GPQPALDLAADALHRAGGDDAFGGAADAHQQVDAGVGTSRHDGAGHVTVGDELDAGAGFADLVHQLVVTRAVEHHHGDVFGARTLRLCDPADVFAGRQADVDDIGRLGAGDELLHVEHGRRVIHRAAR